MNILSKRRRMLGLAIILMLCYLKLTSFASFNPQNTFDIRLELGSYNYHFYRSRLRNWSEGRCIDVDEDNKLIIRYCDPDVIQSFSLRSDNHLVFDRNGLCVGWEKFQENSTLVLKDCQLTTETFNLMNDSYLVFSNSPEGKNWCITPQPRPRLNSKGKDWLPSPLSPCLDDPLALNKCHDEASRIVLMEEEWFQEDRKLLRNLVAPKDNPDCDFKTCALNRLPEPIRKLSPGEISKCTKPWECVTVAVKTARRPLLVIRLAQSIRDSFGYDLPMAVFDDGPDEYPKEITDQMAEFPLLNYVIGEDSDYGIAEGRNKAVEMVKTKYFLLLDDDVLMMDTTDMQMMIDILDTTDATIAGGELAKRGNMIAGFLQFGYFNDPTKTRKMGVGSGTCQKLNRTVPGFPRCFQCDLNTNVFMAKTADILYIGGWDPELKILEHRDLFIRIKAAGFKVGVCRHILLAHAPPHENDKEQAEGYHEKRRRGGTRFRGLGQNRWMFQGSFMKGSFEVDPETGAWPFMERSGGFC